MLTPKQNLLESLKKGGNPVCLNNSYTMMRGTESYDVWGTKILFPEDAPAAVPFVTEENQVIQNIIRWRDYVKVPDLMGLCQEGWEDAIACLTPAACAPMPLVFGPGHVTMKNTIRPNLFFIALTLIVTLAYIIPVTPLVLG